MVSWVPCDPLGCLPKDLESRGRHHGSVLEGMLKSNIKTTCGVVFYPVLAIA